MLNYVRIPDVISLGNGVMGLLAIISSFNAKPELAAIAILIAGIFDFFDGRIARRLSLASPFGVQLDSLCDICSFIVAPCMFLYTVSELNIYLRVAAIIVYLIAGLLRLARFNITGTTGNGKYFEGMPVPFSILLVCLFFLFKYLNIPLEIWAALFFVHAFLMVSTLKIRKL